MTAGASALTLNLLLGFGGAGVQLVGARRLLLSDDRLLGGCPSQGIGLRSELLSPRGVGLCLPTVAARLRCKPLALQLSLLSPTSPIGSAGEQDDQHDNNDGDDDYYQDAYLFPRSSPERTTLTVQEREEPGPRLPEGYPGPGRLSQNRPELHSTRARA